MAEFYPVASMDDSSYLSQWLDGPGPHRVQLMWDWSELSLWLAEPGPPMVVHLTRELPISSGLEERLRAWSREGRRVTVVDPDLPRHPGHVEWNAQGLGLARDLRSELSDQFEVVFCDAITHVDWLVPLEGEPIPRRT